jgi:hypothetical protein
LREIVDEMSLTSPQMPLDAIKICCHMARLPQAAA